MTRSRLTESILINGVEREYLVHSPSAMKAEQAPLPMILAFHGGGGKPDFMDRLTGLNALADQENFLVVYPGGVNKHWNDGRGVHQAADDVAFVEALLDRLQEQYRFDEHKLYATGISNGGFFSQYLTLRLPGRLAAIASVAATTGAAIVAQEFETKPTPIMFIVGMADPCVPYQGGEIRLGLLRRGFVVCAEESLQFWARLNHCSAPPAVSEQTFADGETVFRTQFDPDNGGAEVVQIALSEGGHAWPGGWAYARERMIGKTSKNVNATKEIWRFFQRHKLEAADRR